jgi:magnesium chelatase subunit H
MSDKPEIVAIVGLEHFNRHVWDGVRTALASEAHVRNFTEKDLEHKTPEVCDAIRNADCLFVSMINFKDHAEFLRANVQMSHAKTIFAYESMPEVMALNKVGDYDLSKKSGKGGMPDGVKKVARLLVNGREEDTLYGYTKLMKLMQSMMRFMPAKARDFKNWMQVNIYWNQPRTDNIANMFRYVLREYFQSQAPVAPPVDVPMMGLYHPDAPSMFKDIRAYRKWRRVTGKPLAALLFFRKHIVQTPGYIDDTIRALEAGGLDVLPIFVTGVEGHVVVRDWLRDAGVDVLVSMIGFALIGGPAGSTKPGAHKEAAAEILQSLDTPYFVAQPLYVQDRASWHANGVGPMQSAALFSLPEMDGAIAPVVIGAAENGAFVTLPDRLTRLAQLTTRWAGLRRKANADKRVAFVVYDYPPGMGKKGTAALLDVPRSLHNMLKRLEREGYNVGPLPDTPESLMALIDVATDPMGQTAREAIAVDGERYHAWTTPRERERVRERWGEFPGDVAAHSRDAVWLGGIRFGNIYIGVQPRMGVAGDPMRLLFDKENAPHHQYLSFYRWLSRGFAADALIHVGMHGSVEWMPGQMLGLTEECWSDTLCGELPQLYLYPVNNPSEANIAKRRGYAAIVSHNVPPMARAGLYKELQALRELLNDYRSAHAAALEGADEHVAAEAAILAKVALANLDNDCPRRADEAFPTYTHRLYAYVRDLEERLITNALHSFGEAQPPEAQLTTITEALKARGGDEALAAQMLRHADVAAPGYGALAAQARRGDPAAIALRERIDEDCRQFVAWSVFKQPANGHTTLFKQLAQQPTVAAQIQSGRDMARALGDNRAELDAVVRGLRGGYIAPSPGGDLIRDGLSVLPTGRNIHAIDPWRIPSELAFAKGSQIADAIVQKHLDEHGTYPETIAQVLWGLDTIKTKGEAVAIVLRLIGARPEYDGQGKISHYGLIPLSELGRPRIDVLMQLSPIFRDTFELLMDHLDRLVREAAQADEPQSMNFIKKHVDDALAAGQSLRAATARLFTQARGQYGSYVDDMIDDSAWEKQDDLDAQFIRRNAYAYGGGRAGERAPEQFEKLLGSVARVVHQVDSVEFGVADIDHYFSSSGALQMAAKQRSGGTVKLNYIESYTADTRIDDVDHVLRVEYRTKLLNPNWFENMLKHGRSGAAEISNRFTYMLGWDAVSDSVDNWVYSEAARTYALDDAMRERLERANPQAMRNIVGRLLEANGRGYWQADTSDIERLKSIYADLEDRLEGIAVTA